MKTAAIGMMGVLLLAGGLSAQKAPNYSVQNAEIFTGEITDSFCPQGRHVQIIKSERSCVLTCVKFEGAQFVLYNSESKHIYNLDDQLRPEPYAGQDVTVTGRYDKETKTIHVISIRPKITYASL